MAVNKNFVVKNGFEVNTDLIVADATLEKVGIGTTVPRYVFHVNGGIGATDTYVTGISTVLNEFRVGTAGTVFTVIAGPVGSGNSVGVGTANPAYLLDVRSEVSTGQTALYVQGDVRITGDLTVDDITFDDANLSNLTVSEYLYVGNSPGISTFAGFTDFNGSVDIAVDLNVVGFATLGSYVDINDSVDISDNLNVVGVTTLATVDINAGDIEVSNVDTTDLNVTGIATIATVDINAGDIEVSNVDTTDLNVTGIATLGTVQVSSGVVTATSGIVTYYGDGSGLINTPPGSPSGSNTQVQYNDNGTFAGSSNFTFNGNDVFVSGALTATSFYGDGSNLSGITFGIGISSEGSLVGSGITLVDFRGSGISTVSSGSGIGTIFIESPFTTAIIKETFAVTTPTQSEFNLSNPYGIGYIDVYLNGVKLTNEDYLETGSSQITLMSEAVNGDIVEFVIFKTVTIGITSSLISDLAYNLTGTPDIVVGNITANSVDSGGTSSQFVKGDGSLDANNYSSFSKTVAMSLVFG